VARAGGRCDVERAGVASAGSGKAAAEQGTAHGRAQSGAGAAGVAHMAGQCGGSSARRETEEEGERYTKGDWIAISRKDRDLTVMLK
jgi:hypothetical protein